MANPTFNGFSLQDSNWITESVVFRPYATREVIRAKINRREGVKLLATEFGEKQITVKGTLVASSATQLQTLLDSMKQVSIVEEGQLVIENNRTFTATVSDMVIPDEHYNNSVAPFEITFICSLPFAEATQQTSITPVQSGTFTYSGSVNISGSMFGRPSLVYVPPTNTGHTLIKQLTFTHVPTGQSIVISGFGGSTDLGYQNAVTLNYDSFIALEGNTQIGTLGGFSRWQPGVNTYTITASGRPFPGGNVQVIYSPRYL